MKDVYARIWYWGIKREDPVPEEYKRYKCDYVTELPMNYQGVLIYPEIWANHALDHPECTRAIWWLGVDAYASWTPPGERGAFLKDDSIVHIAQSYYAEELLRSLGVKRLCRCTDVVNKDFYESYEEKPRSNTVLYNPAKATPFMDKIMEACPDITFKPIRGMTRAEVIETMRFSKLYVDFGDFPGRERMPREAVLCGCCLITGKIGAAGNCGDFYHNYQFERKDEHIWAIARKIRYVLDHYEECRKDFNAFRIMLRQDVIKVDSELTGVLDEIQHNHTGV